MHLPLWAWLAYAVTSFGWMLWGRTIILDHKYRLDAAESIYDFRS
jgi:hypothetical protein